MVDLGVVDRVRRGCYAIRPLGVLGTPAWTESEALAVAAAFAGLPHRIGYRSALNEHDLVTQPVRRIQVACSRRIRVRSLSGWPLMVIYEPPGIIGIGAVDLEKSKVSDMERALLDTANRPRSSGGVALLAEAIAMAGEEADAGKIARYADVTGWHAALRRIGSIADALEIRGLAGKLCPDKRMSSDLNLDPSFTERQWRDPRWRVLWPMPVGELLAVAGN